MKQVAISGYYGMSNYGDDLFAITTKLAVEKYWSGYAPVVVGPSTMGLAAKYGSFSFFPIGLYQKNNRTGKAIKAITILGSAIASDKFVFAGGSLFHSSSSIINSLVPRVIKKVSAVGVSLGPFDTIESERKTKELLKKFEYISVRDKRSFEVASSFRLDCPLNQASDLALLYPVVEPTIRSNKLPEERKFIGFTPCNIPLNSDAAKAYCDLFVEFALKECKNEKVEFCILNLNEHPYYGDQDLCAYTAERLSKFGVVSPIYSYRDLGINGVWHLIASMTAYVTVRLHGAVTAYLTGTPFHLFEYHPKCTDFLLEIGSRSEVGGDGKMEGGFEIPPIEDVESPRKNLQMLQAMALTNFTCAPWYKEQ